MGRFLGYTREFTLNIEATQMKIQDEKMFVYNSDELVGVFDVEVMQAAYLTTKKETEKGSV